MVNGIAKSDMTEATKHACMPQVNVNKIKQSIETVKVRTNQHGKIMFAAATNYDAFI